MEPKVEPKIEEMEGMEKRKRSKPKPQRWSTGGIGPVKQVVFLKGNPGRAIQVPVFFFSE